MERRTMRMVQIIKRIIAVFAATALPVLGAGSIVGIDVATAALMAGIGGVATVVEKLARAYMEDGDLSEEDVNAAFASKQDDVYEDVDKA
jgi:hypothetical protein